MKKEIKQVVTYGGHSLAASGSVNLSFKAGYSELVNSVNLLSMLNNDVSIKARMPGSKPFKLGIFRVKAVNIGDDGESVLKFNSLDTSVELNNLNSLVTTDAFTVLYEAELELEGGEEDGEE